MPDLRASSVLQRAPGHVVTEEDGVPPPRVKPGLLARCPALAVALCFIVGIVLHEYLPVLTRLWLLTAGCLAIAALLAPWRWVGNGVLCLAIVALGLAAGQAARFQFHPGHIGLYIGDSPRLAWLEVRLDEAPRLLRTPDSAMPRPPKHVCIAQVTAVRAWDGWRSANGSALLQFDSPAPDVRAGDRLRLFGLLERPGEAMNTDQFDFAAY